MTEVYTFENSMKKEILKSREKNCREKEPNVIERNRNYRNKKI